MLDVWPIDIAAREAEISLDRLPGIVGIADDEASDNVHLVAMDVVDRLQRGIPNFLAAISQNILRVSAQELEIIFENVFNSEKYVFESSLPHQGSEGLSVIGNRRRHALNEVLDIVQSRIDDCLA